MIGRRSRERRVKDRAQLIADRIRGPEDGELETWRRLAWPLGVGGLALTRYAMESLRHRRQDRSGYELDDWDGDFEHVFLPAAEALTGFSAVSGNRAEILINGDEIFPAMLEAIRSATETLHFETYVYWQGGISQEVAQAIAERSREGVTCRVILDAVGSIKMDQSLVYEMRDAGVRVVRFRAPKPWLIGRVTNRTHRRVLVVDGKIGFTGGVGVAEEWTGDAQDPEHWRDTHVRVEGPVVRALQGAFAEHWVESTGEALIGASNLPEVASHDDGTRMAVIRSSSRSGESDAEIFFILALSTAKESIEITSAYFAPRPPFVAAMCAAVERGVRVRVLVPGEHTDKELARVAGRKAYGDLLDCGAEIYEFQPTMIHSKTIQIDGVWGTIGTMNFDNRSLQVNDEISLSAFDSDFAAKLHEEFEHDLSRSQQITLERWAERSVYQKIAEYATKPMRREL